jgi:predicted MFS family arabinose efflux permease
MFLVYAVLLSPIVLASGSAIRPNLRRRMVILGLVGMGTASGVLSLISAHNGRWLWPVTALMFGAGLGLGQVPATETLLSSLPEEAQGVASAVNDITRELGAALGIAIGGALLTGSHGHSGNATNDFLVGFRNSCIVQAVIPLVIACVAIALTRRPGRSGAAQLTDDHT